MNLKTSLVCLILITAIAPPFATAASVHDFLDQPLVKDIRVSPSGEYLAVKMYSEEEGHWLRFVDSKTFEAKGGFAFSGGREVGDFYWANDERVVLEVLEVSGSVEAPRFYGDLFAVNFDGSKKEAIFGFRSGGQQTGTLLKQKKASPAWGDIIDPLIDDQEHILISSTPWTKERDGKATATLLNIYTGVEHKTFKTSKFPFGSFIADSTGAVRMVRSYKEDRMPHLEIYPDEEKGWIDVEGLAISQSFTPVAVSYDRSSIYAFDYGNEDRFGLHKITFADSKMSKIYSHDHVDISEVQRTVDDTGVYGMRVDNGYPSYLLFSNDYEEAQIFKKILGSFPGQLVDITSSTRDGNIWIVKTESDVDPGSFYLFDKQANRLSELFKARPALDKVAMAPIEPIEFTSFDGLLIRGYYTRPLATKADEVPPLVVLVHGGPRARDYWGFNPEVQLLAANGYGVLQINYRGSTGYGLAFLNAGNRHWGDHIQQDIIEGTRWAIKEGRAQAGKICIMGASFGAYSALQSSTLAPDLYACAVANAGIYDLSLLFTDGDIQSRYIGEGYLEEVVGRDKDELARFSPINNVAKLKAPLLIAHGKKDQRAPFEHAEALVKELKKHDIEHELLVKRREGHGFYNVANNVEYYESVLTFLDKHLR